MENLIYLVPAMAVIGLLYTFVKFNWVSKQDAGNERMKEISNHIAEGAMAFLKAEWKILGYFVFIVAILLGPYSALLPVTSVCALLPRAMYAQRMQHAPV